MMFNINDWCFFSDHSCKDYLRIYGGEVITAENQWVIAARSRSRRPMPKLVKKYLHEVQTIWGEQRQRTNLCKSMLTTAGMLMEEFLRTLSDMLIHGVSEKATLWGVQDLRLTAQSIHFLINPWNYQICHFLGSSQSGINRWCWGKSVWDNITWNQINWAVIFSRLFAREMEWHL